jgi:sirohydrochlorin ferrochelatase
LVGHGTRDEQGLAEFQTVARQVAELATEFCVEACFLELAEPDIATGVQRLLERKVRRLTVAPLLLFSAGHAKRDIPAAVAEGVVGRRKVAGEEQQTAGGGKAIRNLGRDCGPRRSECGGRQPGELVIDQLPALECQERIVELSAQRYAEALAGLPPVDSAATLLILVGRGSSDDAAISAVRRFAALRAERTAVGRVDVGFVAVAKPTLEEALDVAARSEFRQIVVQPHLLFVGEVLEQIEKAVKAQREASSGKEWILTRHLGPSPLVAQAVVEMAREAAKG